MGFPSRLSYEKYVATILSHLPDYVAETLLSRDLFEYIKRRTHVKRVLHKYILSL